MHAAFSCGSLLTNLKILRCSCRHRKDIYRRPKLRLSYCSFSFPERRRPLRRYISSILSRCFQVRTPLSSDIRLSRHFFDSLPRTADSMVFSGTKRPHLNKKSSALRGEYVLPPATERSRVTLERLQSSSSEQRRLFGVDVIMSWRKKLA